MIAELLNILCYINQQVRKHFFNCTTSNEYLTRFFSGATPGLGHKNYHRKKVTWNLNHEYIKKTCTVNQCKLYLLNYPTFGKYLYHLQCFYQISF
jgi:hypothetical protein